MKGVITRKYTLRNIYGQLVDNLEYKAGNGKLEQARGLSLDAFTIAWKDLKNKIADEVSQAKAIEDLEMVRGTLYPEESEEKDKDDK